MRKPLVAVAIGVALIAIAVTVSERACSGSRQATTRPGVSSPSLSSTTTAASGAPTQKQLYADIIEKGLTPERAEQLFSMVVGPLPGVTPPTSGRDATDFDGTLAVGYLYGVWSSLTPEQRQAASQLIAPKSAASRVSANHSSVFRNHPPRVVLAAYSAVAADTPAFDYEKMAQDADDFLAAYLGSIPTVQFVVGVEYGPPPPGTEKAHTISEFYPGFGLGWVHYPDGCHITIWNQRFTPLDEVNAKAIVTHEMFHCFQQRQAGSEDVLLTVAAWIVEGEPTWAMAAVVPAGSAVVAQSWNDYATSPEKMYLKRRQDAIGVFGHMSDVAGDATVWERLLPMVTAGASGNNLTALGLLIAGHEISYYTSWGSSYFESPSNQPWRMNGPGSPPTSGPAPDSVTVSVDNDAMINIGPYQARLTQAQSTADIVLVSLMTGYGRLHDQDFVVDTDLDSSGPLGLCLKAGGCTCPDGSPGASLITKLAKAPVSIGSDGGDTTTQIALVGSSLDKFCKKPDQKSSTAPQPGGGGGGGGAGGDGGNDNKKPEIPPDDGGTSVGDPHVTTFDGLHYDLQVVGEFTLVRSTKDDFTVQVRQVPAPGSKTVSVNRAMATKLGPDRVSVTMEGVVVPRINGNIVTGALPALKGGVITRSSNMYGDAYQLTWPDGTVVRAEQSGRFAMNVRVRPAASRRGTLVGLLGDADGSSENDLIGLRDARLGARPSESDVIHSLADAWRITPAQSLFDYAPGQSTATFADRNFPGTAVDPSKIANRAAAEKYCKEMEITDEHLLADCILDLAVTNDFVFGSEYAHAQQVLAARAALAGPPKAPSELATVIMTGEILDSKSQPQFQFNAKKDDVIWVHDPDCTDRVPQFHPVALMLLDPDGKPVEGIGGLGCEFGRRELPATGTYTFKATFMYPNEITKYRIPIRFVRSNRHVSLTYGQAVSGNIEQRAAHDIYTWTGQAGDVIKLSGAGCDLGSMATSIIDPAGHDSFGPGCRADSDYKLTARGTYQLIINSLDFGPTPTTTVGPGAYHFVFQGGAFK
jgi:hypothetical protein